jgi:hypothetical protein
MRKKHWGRGGLLRGYRISLTEFREHPVNIPEDPEASARKGSGKRTW